MFLMLLKPLSLYNSVLSFLQEKRTICKHCIFFIAPVSEKSSNTATLFHNQFNDHCLKNTRI